MKVRGIEHMTLGELVDQVKQGGRFIVFHWCVGLFVKTLERPSTIQFVRPGQRAGRGFWQTMGTLLTGWWAVPFGPSATIACVKENLRGGRDITASVLRGLVHAEHMAIGRRHREESPITSHAA
jgi:hypothetical protein